MSPFIQNAIHPSDPRKPGAMPLSGGTDGLQGDTCRYSRAGHGRVWATMIFLWTFSIQFSESIKFKNFLSLLLKCIGVTVGNKIT